MSALSLLLTSCPLPLITSGCTQTGSSLIAVPHLHCHICQHSLLTEEAAAIAPGPGPRNSLQTMICTGACTFRGGTEPEVVAPGRIGHATSPDIQFTCGHVSSASRISGNTMNPYIKADAVGVLLLFAHPSGSAPIVMFLN